MSTVALHKIIPVSKNERDVYFKDELGCCCGKNEHNKILFLMKTNDKEDNLHHRCFEG